MEEPLLKGLLICLTGDSTFYWREEMYSLIRSFGGRYTDYIYIRDEIDYLLVGNRIDVGAQEKIDYANKNYIPIMTEEEFREFIHCPKIDMVRDRVKALEI